MTICSLISTLFNRNSNPVLKEYAFEIDCQQSAEGDKLIQQELDRQLVVFDVGCRWGFAEKFTKNAGRFRVYGFDPDIEECEKLNQRYKGSTVTVVPIGLAGSTGTRTLYVTKEAACSSLLVPDIKLTENYPALYCAHHVSSVDVSTTTLDTWSNDNNIEIIDYIKIDTQGTELEILKGGINILNTIRALEIEVEFNPIYQGQPIFSDVDLFLRREGFVLWKLTNHVHYSKDGAPEELLGEDIICYDDKHQVRHKTFGGQLYWANAHYVRKSVIDSDESSEAQIIRDIALFQALGMPDVVKHLYSVASNEVG